jgi:lipopolysaccharide exporter
VMTPWVLSQLAVSSVSRVVFVVKGQRIKLYYDVASLILIGTSLWIAARLGWPLIWSVALLSSVQTIAYAFYYVLMLHAIRVFARTGTDETTPVLEFDQTS